MAERTGWRDAWISNRHRSYGPALVAEDVDRIIHERDGDRTVAQIEEKHFQVLATAKLPDLVTQPRSMALASHFYLDEVGNAEPRSTRSASGAVNVFIAGAGPKAYAEVASWISIYFPRLTDGTCAYRVAPLNSKAHRLFEDLDHRRCQAPAYAGIGAVYDMTEAEYVGKLHEVRGLSQIEADTELGDWIPADRLAHIPESDRDRFDQALAEMPEVTQTGFDLPRREGFDLRRRRLVWQADLFVAARDWLATGNARLDRNGTINSLGVRDGLNKQFTDQFWHGAVILAGHALGWRILRGPGQSYCAFDPA
jgi:hypothetical protein